MTCGGALSTEVVETYADETRLAHPLPARGTAPRRLREGGLPCARRASRRRPPSGGRSHRARLQIRPGSPHPAL